MIGRPKFQEYQDFSIFISPDEVRIRSSAGESSGPLRLSLQSDEVRKVMYLMSQATRGFAMRGIESPQSDQLRDIGMQLYSALFEGARMTAFQSSLSQKSNEGSPFRLRLCIDDRELATLPWEFMHDRNSFLGLSPRFSIIRTTVNPVKSHDKALSLQLDSPPGVMIVITSGKDPWIDFSDHEIDRLQDITTLSTQPPIILRNPTLNQIDEVMYKQPVHIFHFIGEIAKTWDKYQYGLLLKYNSGRPQLIESDLIRKVLMRNNNLRIVYLSAPHSDGLASELAKDIPAVIGFSGETGDDAISIFSECLYRNIRSALTIEEAVMQARQEIDRRKPGSREWGLPVFYLETQDSVFMTEPFSSVNVRQSVQTVEQGGTVKGAVVDSQENDIIYEDDELLKDPALSKYPELKKLLALYNIQQKNLEVLVKKQEILGSDTPTQVRSDIENTSKEIRNLTRRFNEIKGKFKL